MSHTERVVILLDMDCFYCQVEEKLNPAFEGKPIAVVQVNDWRGGGIIAVNYPARERGVTRHMRGEDAQQMCPDIILAKVPQIRGKADLSKYRDAGKRVANVLQTFTAILERASIDEAYLDVTDMVLNKMKNGIDKIPIESLKNTYIVGHEMNDFVQNTEFTESNLRLCLGGIISEEIRAEVLKQTGYKCSAGIAHNKILAKLACGLHKPNKQTILPHDAVPEYFKQVPIKKITGLGGKFGDELLRKLNVSKMGELAEFSDKELIDKFGHKNGLWLYNIARGIDTEPVVMKLISKSIGSCKRFAGQSILTTQRAVEHWMNQLSTDISERLQKDLEENNRRARQMVVNFSQEIKDQNVGSSRTVILKSYEKAKIAKDAVEVIKKCCQKSDGSYSVTFLGISITNFQDVKKSSLDITSFFNKIGSQNKLDSLLTKEKGQEILTKSDHNSSTDLTDDDVRSHSAYSASTEEIEEDPSSYIYFEDIYPEFISSQPLDNYIDVDEKTAPFISEENYQTEMEKRKQSSNSFFAKYFSSPPLKRDSSELDSESDPASEELDSTRSKKKCVANSILPYLVDEEPNETYCSECKRNIPMECLDIHSDYHVAKNLQEELNKSETKPKPKNTIKDFFKPA